MSARRGVRRSGNGEQVIHGRVVPDAANRAVLGAGRSRAFDRRGGLSRGMQGLAMRVARNLNPLHFRRGSLWSGRYSSAAGAGQIIDASAGSTHLLWHLDAWRVTRPHGLRSTSLTACSTGRSARLERKADASGCGGRSARSLSGQPLRRTRHSSCWPAARSARVSQPPKRSCLLRKMTIDKPSQSRT
jgi:hypothetical protein